MSLDRAVTLRPFPEGNLALPNDQLYAAAEYGSALAQAIVDTIREPLLVLDEDLCVVLASRSFLTTFKMDRQHIQGRPLCALADGQWNIPELQSRLSTIVPQHGAMEAYEIEQDFSGIGRRTMLLNARKVFYQGGTHTTILLAMEDVTERRAAERETTELLQQKETLLLEMQHRVANSLQIIASILLIKARTVQTEETRLHLHDAHQRVMSVAAMQQQLQASRRGELIELGPYLSRLCESLAASMIGDSRPIALNVKVEGGTASSTQAVSIGLIVTELVMNALKHAFPNEQTDCRVIVAYDFAGNDWKLSVSDNGIGKPGHLDKSGPGLGSSIVEALAKQLGAVLDISTEHGRTVSVTHASFTPRPPAAT